jgi:hypothetical protein
VRPGLEPLPLPVHLWDRQGPLPVFSWEMALPVSGSASYRIAGVFEIRLFDPSEAYLDTALLAQRAAWWRQRLHSTLAALWRPPDLVQGAVHHAGHRGRGFARYRFEHYDWHYRMRIPERLVPHLAIIAAFELDPDAESIYRDWCLEHDWSERFPVPVARTTV